jgi:hypothetical protein
MKECIQNLIKQIAEEEVTRNSVSRHAQEVILRPDIPDADKDEVVDAAVETIRRIGQNRTTYNAIIDAHKAKQEAYNANRRESRRLKRSHTI